MEQRIPIQTLHLFPVLDKMLIDLLISLTPQEWHKPTVARLWSVKDVAAHLLDGNLRVIAALDNYTGSEPAPQITSYQDLVTYLNELNAVWVKAMRRVSPQWITDQLEATGKPYFNYLQTLQPFEPAQYAVAWAGEETSMNWFHIAREYTEKFHHQQQIRDAVGKPGIITKELFYPCICTFMYALPHAYRNVTAADGTILKIAISTEAGGIWYLQKTDSTWKLVDSVDNEPLSAEITINPDAAWKIFTKAIMPQAATSAANITGDESITRTFFNTIAVMA